MANALLQATDRVYVHRNMAAPSPSEFIRKQLIQSVRAVFNDQKNGQQPVGLSDNALFAKDTPIRMVHADVVGMMAGGMSALLLQMLHPGALQGVLDHSDFRHDMLGRLRRTARFIAVTTFGDRNDAAKAIERVNRIHAAVGGTLPDGSRYAATDPEILAWVHACEATSFLDAYIRYAKPAMPRSHQDEYFRQFAEIAHALGAHPVPETRRGAQQFIQDMRPKLSVTDATREIADLVLSERTPGTPLAVQRMLGTAAVDLLPRFAKNKLGLDQSVIRAAPARLATGVMAGTLRWAFRQN
ncbi:oxygenase MpaB family protein [Altererythrobacter aquiaggeris]|uniref:oxygenase MpaB family protein n=1 Tax=Aestuarierythrobacter aquiaggeris TaxID=1898396 RepID=UPI00301A7D7A